MVNVLPQLTRFGGAALNLLFPRFCVGCGKEGVFLCGACVSSLPHIQPPVCPECGLPQSDGSLCRNCQDWQADIDGIRSPFRFEGAIREAVHYLKYRNLRAIAPALACLMADYLENNPLNVEVLVPVPLHKQRLRLRGYNQSALLANELGKRSCLRVDETVLVREKYALPQARTSSVAERRANVMGVFTCRGRGVNGKRVLLIDDVATSGATMNACASALKAGGAVVVWGLALAREI
ncbi:MAG: ComF family protein [Dehalococcoidia bacterium]|nr:ComF family protein [Dehalococcoidia bacterium]